MTAEVESSPQTNGAAVESTPSSEPQVTEPQAQPQADSTPVETPPLSPRERLKQVLQDPEMQSAYREHLNAEAQRIADKKLKREKLAKAKDDPAAALEFAQSEYQATEAEDAQQQAMRTRYADAEKALADLWKDPKWAEVYNELRTAEGAKFHAEWAKDPMAFLDNLDDRITEILIDRRAAEKAKAMTEARVLEETNKRLGSLPVPPTGNAGSGRFTLEQIAAMDSKTYRANEEAIDRQYGLRK